MIRLKITKKDIIFYIILILLSIIMTMCNYIIIEKEGFLYTDVAVWTNIAKGMNEGKLIYKDMFDHKGPMLYAFYYLGYIIANQFGIWILDFIFNLITTFMIYFIYNQFIDKRLKFFNIIFVIMLFAVKIFNENPCVESIALPFTLIALYYVIKFILNNDSLKNKEILLIAMSFSIVLLLRPNLVVLWILFYLYLFTKIFKEKKLRELRTILVYSLLGISIIIVPVIIYLISNNIFIDFINSYLLFNLQYTTKSELNIMLVIQLFNDRTNYIIPIIGGIYIGLFFMKNKITKKEMKLLKFSVLYYITAFFMIIMPQRCYFHYVISMIPTLIVPLVILLKYIDYKRIYCTITVILFSMFVIESYYVHSTKILFSKSMSNYKEKMQSVVDLSNKDDNVLVLGNTTRIYLMIDREYKGKYFYQLPIGNQDEKIAKAIIDEITEQSPKFIIDTMSLELEGSQQLTVFEEKVKRILDEKYYTRDAFIYELINK